MKTVDLSGQTIGRWLVIARAPNRGAEPYWKCKCACGAEKEVIGQRLRTRTSLSCGCYRREKPPNGLKHGQYETREYAVWGAIKARCNNPRNPSYDHYGARGIKMCERWANAFEAFLADMGPCPKGRSIDRIDNDKGYSPDNCRWATRKQQARNTTRSRKVTVIGERLTLAECGERYGVSRLLLRSRLVSGWPVLDAIAIPPNGGRP